MKQPQRRAKPVKPALAFLAMVGVGVVFYILFAMLATGSAQAKASPFYMNNDSFNQKNWAKTVSEIYNIPNPPPAEFYLKQVEAAGLLVPVEYLSQPVMDKK